MDKMTRNKFYTRSLKLDRIILGIDMAFVLSYVILFLVFFNMIIAPENPEIVPVERIYDTFIGTLNSGQLNTVISLLAMFMIVSIPSWFLNLKKHRNRDIYDLSIAQPINSFVQGIISLLLFNPFSMVVRFMNTFALTNMIKGYGFVGVLKAMKQGIVNLFDKEKRALRKEIRLAKREDESELSKNIRMQVIFKIVRFTITYLFLGFIALIIFIPFYWMIITSLKTYYESSVNPDPRFFIALSEMQWVNFKYVLNSMDFGLYIKNTLIVGVFSTIGTLLTTVLAAFAFARLQFKGRETIFSILLMTMMIPGEIFIITNFLTVSRTGFGWIGAESGNLYYLAMIVPFMTSVFYIFFLRQSFKQIPESLYKAARVDGCSDFKYLMRVMIPIASPTISTIVILNVIGSWNAFIWPRLITAVSPIDGADFWLISVALRQQSFTTSEIQGVMFNLQIAASALVTVPLIIVFLTLRKYIMSGVGRSGTKG